MATYVPLLDEYLQKLRNSLGIGDQTPELPSDMKEWPGRPSSYLNDTDASAHARPMPVVHLPEVQMERETPPHPAAPMPTERVYHPQQVLEDMNRLESLKMPGSKPPRFEPGDTAEGDVFISGHGQMMSPQEAQDYLDFISPHGHDDADLPAPAVAALRRRR